MLDIFNQSIYLYINIYNMERIKCEICGKIFEYEKISSCRAILTRHLREVHNLTTEEYYIQLNNGIQPKCACGCGEYVRWNSKKWKWNKYYEDSHVGKENHLLALEIKNNLKKSNKKTFNLKYYYENKYDKLIAETSLRDFLSKEYTLDELSEKYALDKRTLKKMWFELQLIDADTYNDITSYLKYKLSGQKRSSENLLNSNYYTWAFALIKEHPQKYTISSLINEYNRNNIDKITINSLTFYKIMKNIYGDEVDIFLAKGYHSKDEYLFCEILKFFLPNIRIKLGFKMDNERYSPIYDICINDKYIIEYDAKGTFHNNDEQRKKDLDKEKKAIELGYKFMRLNYNDIHNTDIIERVKQWLNL